MSTAPAAVRNILLADASVAALVGDRIYPDWVAQASPMPCIVLWTTYSDARDLLNGAMGFENSTVRVECIGLTRAQADDLMLLVNPALVKNPKRGMFGGVHVDSITQSSGTMQMADRPYDGSDRWLYRTIQSFKVNYHLFSRESC